MPCHGRDRGFGDRRGARGAIFTRSEVVDFILDLAGYTEDQLLHEKRLLEPSFGGGDFLLPIIQRLLSAWRAARPLGDIFDAVFVVGSYTSMCMGRDTTAHLCQASPESNIFAHDHNLSCV